MRMDMVALLFDRAQLAVEGAIQASSMYLMYLLMSSSAIVPGSRGHQVLTLYVLFVGVVYFASGVLFRMPTRRWTRIWTDLLYLIKIQIWTMLIAFAVAWLLHIPHYPVVSAALIAMCVQLFLRIIVRAGLSVLRRQGKNVKFCVVVTDTPKKSRLMQLIQQHPELGVRVVSVVSTNGVQDLPRILREHAVDIIFSEAASGSAAAEMALGQARTYGKEYKAIIGAGDLGAMRASDFFGETLLSWPQTPYGIYVAFGKRVMDMTLATIGAGVALPIVVVVALIIKWDDPLHSVFYRQTRIGLNGRKFEIYKFRTMAPQEEQPHITLPPLNVENGFKIPNDPRVTKPGRWLRKLSLDELPQLWNVIRGDMSLVGPRPAVPDEVVQYPEDHYWRRLSIRPGLTGAWQISGRNEVEFHARMGMDLEYVEHGSFSKDLRILIATIPSVLRGRGAS